MDNTQRDLFWKKLCSLKGDDVDADWKELNGTIILPRYLYRYRPTSIKSIDALRTNKLYFSTSNYYDDPFDTFINVNINSLKQVIDKLMNDDIGEGKLSETLGEIIYRVCGIQCDSGQLVGFIKDLRNSFMKPGSKEWILEYVRNIRNEIKKDIWSVCFSEDGFNETLWLKYAQQHKGFVVQYDLDNVESILCGKYDKCGQCGVLTRKKRIYPMVYSDTEYDGTRYAQYIAITQSLNIPIKDAISDHLRKTMGGFEWEKEKITLIKKKCHEYDKEWRMILDGTMKGPVMMEWKPEMVIMGLNIDEAESNLVISAAKEAGISKICKSFIDDEGRLNARQI